ncbi:MAG: CS1-pili formation C-terminal domain-containing protein [Acinetobacter sp.]
MLPGKMKLREVTVESQYTFVGQLVTQDGKPLTPQAMLNASIFSGADDGGFSAELNHLAKNLYVQKGNTLYRCPVTIQATRDVVRYVGKTVCTAESWSLLPAEIQEVAAARKLAATMLTEGK